MVYPSNISFCLDSIVISLPFSRTRRIAYIVSTYDFSKEGQEAWGGSSDASKLVCHLSLLWLPTYTRDSDQEFLVLWEGKKLYVSYD